MPKHNALSARRRILPIAFLLLWLPTTAAAATYYVRQTVGDDTYEGSSPDRAWHSFSRLQGAMHAGDTAYVGPGLYREGITLMDSGTLDARLTFVADPTGEHTGDPPGVVMVTGADPVDESALVPHGPPGVYEMESQIPVIGAVEMDGDQLRYVNVTITYEFRQENMAPVDIVAKLSSSYFYDDQAHRVYLHTSDGKAPTAHEIELMHRLNGIGMVGKHYVTVTGFTFRHFGDAGINFFQGSGDGIAFNNTSYGNRQGIRVYTGTNIYISHNTLFKNENCGAYFAVDSVNGAAVDNILYENIKGLRWGSRSINGLAIGNVAFDNRERGISVEDTNRVVLTGNRLVNNANSQLFVIPPGEILSEGNCFENRPEQMVADFFHAERFPTLANYHDAKHQDVTSREGGCGSLPSKIDVHKLHAETTAYTERARKILAAARKAGEGTTAGKVPQGTRQRRGGA